MTTLRYGILGTGNIAHQFAAGVFSSAAPVSGATRCTITAAASRSAEKSQAFCEPYGIEHALDSYQALIDLPSETCDAVYNALPNNLHAEWTIKALEAGKHVLCEKPIAMDAAEAATMFDAARANGRSLVEAFMYRTHPQTLAILDAIRGGAIGQVKLVRTSFCFNARHPEGNTRFVRALGGGALMDIGCYCVDLAMLVARAQAERDGQGGGASGSAVDAIHATGRLTDQGIDVSASGVLTFANGVASTFDCAMDAQASNLAQVCGTEGYIDIPVPWKPPEVGARWVQRGMTPPKQDTPPGRSKHLGGEEAGGPYEHEHTTDAGQALYALEADAFARVALDGEAPFVTEADSLERMRVLDELRRQVGVRWD